MSGDRLIDALCTTPALAEIFDDRSVLAAMLAFEAALARVQARAGIIPGSAGEAIASTADTLAHEIDTAVLVRETRRHATPAIPLVAALVDAVRRVHPGAAAYVHWGATSQDVADTALVLLLRRARPFLEGHYNALTAALRRLSDEHAATPMLGRTLLQPATPITFGLKAAVWHSIAADGWSRVAHAFDEVSCVQFGGATGTRSALGGHAATVAGALARELGLWPSPPWHTDRGRVAAVVTACAIFAGGLGKIARDVALLMQPEVGEVLTAGGGSSAMPHKRNPSGCAAALAAAMRVPGFAAGMMSGLVQEHERGLGGWQLEWPAVSDTVQAIGAALAAVADTIGTLQIFPDRMRANLDATNGAIFAERVSLRLRAAAGREAADSIVSRALERSRDTGVTFVAALQADAEAVRALGSTLDTLDRLDDDVASAEAVRRELLAQG